MGIPLQCAKRPDIIMDVTIAAAAMEDNHALLLPTADPHAATSDARVPAAYLAEAENIDSTGAPLVNGEVAATPPPLGTKANDFNAHGDTSQGDRSSCDIGADKR